MKLLLGGLAVIAVVFGFVNFFLNMTGAVPRGGAQSDYLPSVSIAVSHPLAIIGFAYLLIAFVLPARMGQRTGPGVEDRVRLVRSSGAEIASAWCGGRIGRVRFRGPLLNIAVYPTGLLIQPILMSPAVILRAEIRRLEVKRQFIIGTEIRVVFSSPDLVSPLALFITPDSALASAIEHITRMSFSDAE
jgi:hypothetical protein